MSELVQRIRFEVSTLTKDRDLENLLRQEETWLRQAERTVKEVQQWRDLEAYRFWPGVVYRWAFALAFALFAVWASGAGYAWMNQDRDRQLSALRARLERLDFIEQRVTELTPAEHRQLNALLKWPQPPPQNERTARGTR